MDKKVRVRFAPSPTGGLHLGGVRTVLFNYLFAKHHGGDFIVRIEDTDQTRFVAGAEAYIFECLAWCGLTPDESPLHGGPHAPYRQSERKAMYSQYAMQLVQNGQAYYAFDTPEELDAKRKEFPNFQYNYQHRTGLRNSLMLSEAETQLLLQNGTPWVIRIKMPDNEDIRFTDMIRGDVHFNSSQSDDKVLLKADGMPTYHLAVVVDDYLMQITHAFRGEEWLPSAPVHVLLWQYLFGLQHMPQWAHLPLILKPDGNGKLSKRDGDRLGFPVFAMNWTDPRTNDFAQGFRERGFLPEAFVNMLAMLGWNDGTGQEIFSLPELIERFSMDRVHKGGAKFDFEKAKWFNQEWIKNTPVQHYSAQVKLLFEQAGILITNDTQFETVLHLVKERCIVLNDFVQQAAFFFATPQNIDIAAIKPKWDEKKNQFFLELIRAFELTTLWQHDELEKELKEMAAAHQLKPGELMLPLRIMLVGGKFGPGVFDIAGIIGREATISRITHTLQLLQA
ncbi:glutamate--tRNA ligase [Panacibacter sp. KCS-6]|uniref:Glutamate--tRNA ligase n=2 Tax=Limnovirga soli TaxID=2656915 RepID=A0A8J8FGQ1_9BACT|nr:glutamate--tRNA ligase [Limnovirga soli]